MKVRATFIGKDGSLGYLKGKEYLLTVNRNSVQREDGTGYCEYGTIELFLKNWAIH